MSEEPKKEAPAPMEENSKQIDSPVTTDKDEEEERRLRERLKARAAERQPRGGPPPARNHHHRHRRHSSSRDDRRYHPYHRRGSGSSGSRRYNDEEDDFGRRRRHSPPRRPSRSPDRGSARHRRSRSRSSHSYSSYSSSDSSVSSSSSSSSSNSSHSAARQESKEESQAVLYSKDQRTVFVQQLVQRTTERDLQKYFKKQGLKVNEVILLRDKRSGRHKGCAYVEMKRMDDVHKAVSLSQQVPTFQRFPILVKASEAEKNYLSQAPAAAPSTAPKAKTVEVAPLNNLMAKPPPMISPNGKLQEAQKVYVGSLDPSVTQEHLFLLYSQFGYLDKVVLQTDSATGISKGFAFLSFHDPKEAFLAIQTMNGQSLAGRPMKTGWAVNQVPSVPGAEIVTTTEFPVDASNRTTQAYRVLGQLTMGVSLAQIRLSLASGEVAIPAAAVVAAASRVPTVADARASLAAQVAAPPPVPTAPATAAAPTGAKQIGRADAPTPYILVHNMYDKDEETEQGWEEEIKEEFEEECSQYGKILAVKVMSTEPGGKIYASFESVDGAQKCASSIAG